MAALSHPCEVCANVDIDLEDGVRHCTKSEKLDGELWRAVDTLRGGGAVSGDAAKLRVVVELGDDPPSIEGLFEGLDVQIESVAGRMVQVEASLETVLHIAKEPSVRYVRQPHLPMPFQVASEGVSAIRADLLHARGMRGEAVKVAVIDLGFDVGSPEISSNIAEVQSFRSDGDISGGGGEDMRHGTAVAEIVVDVAPQCRLHLYNFETDIEFLNAVDHVIAAGVEVLSLSLGFVNVGPYDGTSYISQAVNKAWSRGIIVVSAAGNEAHEHWSGGFIDEDGDKIAEFSPGDETNEIQVEAGALIRVCLSWDDWPLSQQDYDLVLYNSSLALVAFSSDPQTGGQPPTESIIYLSPVSDMYRIAIARSAATRNVKFDLYCFEHELEHFTPQGSITSPADAHGVVAVGATYFKNDQIEYFSSQGPTADGRVKPDVTAPDGVTTASLGAQTFYGTSASTPHVAGLAALLKGFDPGLTPQRLKEILEETALDLGVPGKDNVYGSGRVDAYAALNELIGPPVQFQLQVLASTEAWQYPALPPVNLTVEVSVSYLQNGVLVAENRTTPFSIKADQGSATTLTARSIPMGYGWVEWDNYGFGRTKAVTMEVRMDGDRTAVAYVKEAATNMTQVTLTIHAHPDAYQYPEEPVAELNATLEMTYQTNGTWKMQEPQTMGPEAFTLHVDRDSSVKLEVTQIPEPYLWHEWDEYGKGRGPSLGITILMDKDKTAVAYFTPKTAHGGDFTITANPLTQYFIPGQTVNYTLKITAYDGFEDNVSLTILTLPPSTDATLIPATIRPNGTSTLIVMTTPNTPLTPNILVVNASGGGKSHTVQLTLSPAQIPGFDQTTITIGVLLGALLLIKGRQVSTGSPARSLRRKFQ